jgi:tetratricopeptide (TPR) repeat protein
MIGRAVLGLILLSLAVGVAHADDVNAAREHFQRGSTAYDLGRFLDAAHEYEAAYEAKRDPTILFNIGQAYRFVPDYGKAILAFKAYLRNAPAAPNRADVEARIIELQRTQQATNAPPALKADPSSGASEPPSPSGHTLLIAGSVTAAVGVALVVAGGAVVPQTRAADDAVNRPKPGTPFSPSLVDTLNRDQALEASFFAIGGAALITGAVVAILGGRKLRSERKLAWAPFIQSGATGAVLAGAW